MMFAAPAAAAASAAARNLHETFVGLADDAHGRDSLARWQDILSAPPARAVALFDSLIADEGWDDPETADAFSIAEIRAWLGSDR